MLTPQQIFQLEEKLKHMPDALKRADSTDYTEGFFFVTLNVHERLPILGQVCASPMAEQAAAASPLVQVRLSALGEAVLRCWEQIPDFHPGAEIIAAQVMPEHFHGLLHLHGGEGVHLGKIINGFMIGCTHAYWDILEIPWRSMVGRTDGQHDSQWTDSMHKESLRGPSLFEAGYNETTPISPDEVATKVAYIRSNPERRLLKGTHRNLFKLSAPQQSANWHLSRVERGLEADVVMRQDASRRQEALQQLLPRLLTLEPGLASTLGQQRRQGPQNGQLFPQPPAFGANGIPSPPKEASEPQLALRYVGRREVLMHERILPLICHRADERLREQQVSAVLREARAGAVIASAFISPRERAIRDLLMQEGHPVIEVIDNGMSDFYKPRGKAFYYCAEGKLLQITCWNYRYQKESTITRPMCMVMNELVRLISGKPDDWWKT